jgi:hypothetical protein
MSPALSYLESLNAEKIETTFTVHHSGLNRRLLPRRKKESKWLEAVLRAVSRMKEMTKVLLKGV